MLTDDYAHPTKADEPLVERGTVEDFAQACRARFGVNITDIASAPDQNDGRDVLASLDGKQISLQLTEIKEFPPKDYADWSRETFEAAVDKALDKKEDLRRKMKPVCIQVECSQFRFRDIHYITQQQSRFK